MVVGFSTGSLAKGDFNEALRMVEHIHSLNAIELSALRESELPILIKSLPHLTLHRFKYVSFHAPSKLVDLTEDELISYLLQVVNLEIPVIVHPDIIKDYEKWKVLRNFLCIENMDKRKPIGRTTEDLKLIFDALPDARFCLDLAHAKQIDPSMTECAKMLRHFHRRITQFHISDVTSDSNHVAINMEAIEAFRKIASLISVDIPFIIESQVPEDYIQKEFNYVSSVFHINHHYTNHHRAFITDNPEDYLYP